MISFVLSDKDLLYSCMCLMIYFSVTLTLQYVFYPDTSSLPENITRLSFLQILWRYVLSLITDKSKPLFKIYSNMF